MEGVKEVVREFILKTYLPGESADNLRDDTPLLTSGILDSLAVMTFATFIEQQFSIELDVLDTTVERFNCIRDIAATIGQKQLKAHPQGGASR
jgi:acyl carrier protein